MYKNTEEGDTSGNVSFPEAKRKRVHFMVPKAPQVLPNLRPHSRLPSFQYFPPGEVWGEILKITGLCKGAIPCSPGLGAQGGGDTFLGTLVWVRHPHASDLLLQPPEETAS